MADDALPDTILGLPAARLRKLAARGRRLAWLGRVQLADPAARGRLLRQTGAHIGEGCVMLTKDLGTEPYLVTIGDHVWVATGCLFVTHDTATWALGEERPTCGFAPITIGSWCFIGARAILLPGTRIADNCVGGAGSVVRGAFPARSVITGVPGRVTGSIDDYAVKACERELPLTHGNRSELRAQLEAHLLSDSAGEEDRSGTAWTPNRD